MRGSRREYQRLMKGYRQVRSRLEVGLNPRSGGRGGQRSTALRQPDVDLAVGSGVGVYQKIESGRLRPSPELFADIAKTLRFSPHDRRVAHLDLFKSEPLPPAAAPSPHWQRVVDGQRDIMCALAPDGRLIAYNGAFAEALFEDGTVPENFLRWALLSSSARENVLVGWEKEWAPYLIEECRLQAFRHPDDLAVRSLYAEVTSNPRLQTLPRADTDLDGRVCSLRHLRKGTGRVSVLAAESAGVRLLTLLFDGA